MSILLQSGLWGWIGSIVYPVFRFLQPPAIPEKQVNYLNVGKIDDFEPDSGRIVKFGRQPVILLRLKSGEFRAFSAICTHLECIVQFRKDLEHIWCACHNGHYDLQGRNISGPPPRPLPVFSVKIADGNVVISRPEI